MRDLAGEDQQVDLFVDEPTFKQRIQDERGSSEIGARQVGEPTAQDADQPVNEGQGRVHGELAGATQPGQDQKPLRKELDRIADQGEADGLPGEPLEQQ